MKICLLTYWSADNYGATLQAYATIKILNELGHEVQLLNLSIDAPRNSLFKKFLLYPKHLKFQSFRKKYFKNLTKPYLTLSELQKNPPKADYYLIGSDQTWNPDIAKDKTKAFFLDFGNDSVKKITYAASFGKSIWEDSNWISIKELEILLKNFSAIAIREKSGVDILRNLGIESIQVLDPVLLFNSYPEFVDKQNDNNLLVLYKLVNSNVFYNKAKCIGRSLNLDIRSIGSLRKINGIQCAYPESIQQWMKSIANGKFVITDSFHGTVISLLYKKQFVVCVGDPKLVTRIASLLELVGLKERIMSVNDSADSIIQMLNKKIDYQKIDMILTSERNKSIDYLIKTII